MPDKTVRASTSTASSVLVIDSDNATSGEGAVARLRGKRVAMVAFSSYPDDPRPRRAAEALADRGMDVDMICLRENGEEATRDILNRVHIRRIPIRRRRGGVFGYIYQYSAFTVVCSLLLALKSIRRRYDLIYVHNMPDILVLC